MSDCPSSFHVVHQAAARSLHELPAPGPEEQAHLDALADHIREEIAAAGGSIDFARFMELALYAPGLGYYTAGKRKFGEAGDFVTAPELSPLYARCVARQCRQVLARLGCGDILEVGAGSGILAAGLLEELEHLDCLPEVYFILELSAELRSRQAKTLKQSVPRLFDRVRWLDGLPAPGFRGVVLGNELLDAMPVHRFRVAERGLQALHIAWRDGRFAWRETPMDPRLAAVVAARIKDLALPIGYTSEVNASAAAWVRTVAEVLDVGLMLLIDYGFPRPEFYHPQRVSGTLMCHYRHRAHGDPLILTGLQDITAHVEFTALAEAAHDAGLAVMGYTSQASFLIATGLMEFVQAPDAVATRTRLALTQQVKKLTLPHEMGELFKVIAFGRGVPGPLLGFQLQDRRGRL